MILVDTSIWIDHLHAAEPRLISLLADDEIGCHPLVIEELSLGSIKKRDDVLGLLSNLYQFPTATHAEVLHLVERRRLWGRGIERNRCSSPRGCGVGGWRTTMDQGQTTQSGF